jgi:adenosylcobinamide-GDP ribazoletransferase
VSPARDFLLAMRFLTCVPLPAAAPSAAIGFGARAFPVVGLLIGAGGIVTDEIAFALPGGVRDAAIIAAWAAITGAIHYDGLADVLDALGATGRDERLRVMRDAAVGVFAVLGLLLVVATQLAALAELHGAGRTTALLAAPAIGRWAMVIAAIGARSAREDGLGAAFVRDVSTGDMVAATVITLAAVTIVAGRYGWAACVFAAVATAAIRAMSARAFGGVTGDVLGACGVVAETVALVVFAAR